MGRGCCRERQGRGSSLGLPGELLPYCETEGRVQECEQLTGPFCLDVSGRLHQILAKTSQGWQGNGVLFIWLFWPR